MGSRTPLTQKCSLAVNKVGKAMGHWGFKPLQRQTLESNKFRLSKTRTKQLKCKSSDVTHEVDVEVRIDTQFHMSWINNPRKWRG